MLMMMVMILMMMVVMTTVTIKVLMTVMNVRTRTCSSWRWATCPQYQNIVTALSAAQKLWPIIKSSTKWPPWYENIPFHWRNHEISNWRPNYENIPLYLIPWIWNRIGPPEIEEELYRALMLKAQTRFIEQKLASNNLSRKANKRTNNIGVINVVSNNLSRRATARATNSGVYKVVKNLESHLWCNELRSAAQHFDRGSSGLQLLSKDMI